MLPDLVGHQVVRVIRSIFQFLNPTLLRHQLNFLSLKLFVISVYPAIKILNLHHVDVNVRKSILIPLVARSNRKVVENRITDLLLAAPGVCHVSIGIPSPHINVVHENPNSNATARSLVEVEITAIPIRHDSVKISAVGHGG